MQDPKSIDENQQNSGYFNGLSRTTSRFATVRGTASDFHFMLEALDRLSGTAISTNDKQKKDLQSKD